jgi:hypothetical protein
MPEPVGAVTVIVPVATLQFGCSVALAMGAAGVSGCSLMVTLVAIEIHPEASFALTE